MSSKTQVVTGGAGFIGSHLCRALLERDGPVRVIDDLSTGKRARLEPLLREYGDRLEFLELDIRDLDALRKSFDGADVIYHQAAVPSVPRSIEDPVTSNTANIDGTLNVFLAARDAAARKVVYASSSSVYGNSESLPKHEGLPMDPLSPYAVTKSVCEMYGKLFPRLYDLPTVGLRYFNVFGPSQDPMSQYAAVVPRFVTRMLDGKGPIIYGDGEQSRDFTYVDNAIHANLCAAESEVAGIAVNVACGERFSLNQLLEVLNGILGTDLAATHEPPRAGDVRHSQADISLAREALGFEPKISFEKGVRRTVEWFQRQADAA